MDNIEKYKVAKKTAKRVVSVVKGRAYEDLYQYLSTKEGEKAIYRMARVRVTLSVLHCTTFAKTLHEHHTFV